MHKKIAVLTSLLIACLFMVSLASAADDPSKDPEMAARVAAAQKYLGVTTDVKTMVERMVSDVSRRMPPEQAEKFREAFSRFSTPERLDRITKRMMLAMASTFNVEEIEALTQFYGSAVGKAIADKMPQYATKSSMILSQEIVEFAKQEREKQAQAQEQAPEKAQEPKVEKK